MPDVRILCGDVVEQLRTLESDSIHCVVTSPPYWGLRDYGYPGQIGLEKSFNEYLLRMVEVFRHVRRVLHSTGSVWLNMGDSYARDGGEGFQCSGLAEDSPRRAAQQRVPVLTDSKGRGKHAYHSDPLPLHSRCLSPGFKVKDLMMQPAQLALALQADGWYLRSMIPWLKRNGMPESTTDRPTSMVEYIFLLSKSEEYFYDREAVRLAASPESHPRGNGVTPKAMGPNSRMRRDQDPAHQSDGRVKSKQNRSFSMAVRSTVATRARRNTDWFFTSVEDCTPKFQGLMVDGAGDPLAMVVNPQPFSLEMCGACSVIYAQRDYRKLPQNEKESRICACGQTAWVSHFATFPERMVTPCILAGTSEYGCCHRCGAPYARILEKQHYGDWHPNAKRGHGPAAVNVTSKMATSVIRNAKNGDPVNSIAKSSGGHDREGYAAPITTGWRPTCDHPLYPHEVVPCVVLDIFNGSGRTGLAATKLGRQYVGIEGSKQYVRMTEWQFEQMQAKAVAV